MSEETLPKPFPEARPPHLPDVMTRQSPWLLIFVGIAGLVAWRSWISWGPSAAGEEVSSLISFVTFASSILAPPLFGVALFARHPNAWSTMPLLVFGLGLMGFGVLLTAFGDQIREVLRGTASFDEFQTPGETAFLVFKGLVALFGVLYAAAGLSAARSAPRSRAERPVAIWLTALTVVSIVLSLRTIADLFSAGEYPPDLVIPVAIGFVLSIASNFAWLYLTAVVVGGWLAPETPSRAWLAAAIGVLLLFVSPLVVGFAFVMSGDGNSPVLPFFNYATLGAWVLLVAAFAIGLPTPVGARRGEPVTADPPGATQPGS
ncbi:MAG TPA: hypothetical protein VK867_08600 [Candidatus Limnocylindrales bacterium]|nr:hypothetical protein [Candidatus Limnocylindrales bacterium]